MQLLEHVLRLEPVFQILDASGWPDAALARLGEGTIGTGARILALAQDYDALAGRGLAGEQVMQKLRTTESRYGKEMLDKYATEIGDDEAPGDTSEIAVGDIQLGMIILQDLRGPTGTLLATRVYKVTRAFCERLENFSHAMRAQTVRVLCSAPARDP